MEDLRSIDQRMARLNNLGVTYPAHGYMAWMETIFEVDGNRLIQGFMQERGLLEHPAASLIMELRPGSVVDFDFKGASQISLLNVDTKRGGIPVIIGPDKTVGTKNQPTRVEFLGWKLCPEIEGNYWKEPVEVAARLKSKQFIRYMRLEGLMDVISSIKE